MVGGGHGCVPNSFIFWDRVKFLFVRLPFPFVSERKVYENYFFCVNLCDESVKNSGLKFSIML